MHCAGAPGRPRPTSTVPRAYGVSLDRRRPGRPHLARRPRPRTWYRRRRRATPSLWSSRRWPRPRSGARFAEPRPSTRPSTWATRSRARAAGGDHDPLRAARRGAPAADEPEPAVRRPAFVRCSRPGPRPGAGLASAPTATCTRRESSWRVAGRRVTARRSDAACCTFTPAPGCWSAGRRAGGVRGDARAGRGAARRREPGLGARTLSPGTGQPVGGRGHVRGVDLVVHVRLVVAHVQAALGQRRARAARELHVHDRVAAAVGDEHRQAGAVGQAGLPALDRGDEAREGHDARRAPGGRRPGPSE